MDNIYVSTRFGHGNIASGMWDQQRSQLLYEIAALVFICDFCLFSHSSTNGQKEVRIKPLLLGFSLKVLGGE